jgi:hypothetical protein
MLNQKRHHVPRPASAARPLLSIRAMAYAQEVAADFKRLETGYRNGLYNFFGRALTSYRKFLKDPDGYKALLSQDNIVGLPEKPELKTTSRLVLYFLTNAQNEAERNTAGKYARVVDYLHKERVDNGAAADHVRSAGGMDAILKRARGREALKAADETLQDDDRDFDRGEEPDETRTRASASGNTEADLFDPEKDLSIRVGSETLERVLGADINSGRSFYLECKKTGPVGRDGIRIVGRLDPPSA